MKYRSKLCLAFFLVSVVASIAAVIPLYYTTKKLLFQELSSKALSIAASISLQVPASLVLSIQTEKDMDLPPYKKIRALLDAQRNIQRAHGVLIEDILLVQPSNKSAKSVMVIVDAPVHANRTTLTGTIYEEQALHKERIRINQLFSSDGFIKDNYGTWLIGYAPIFDANKNYVATVLVSIKSTDILQEIAILLWYGLVAGLFALIISSIASLFFGKKLGSALNQLCKKVAVLAKGDLSQPIKIDTKDEFADLGSAIDQMRLGLKEREKLKENFSCYVSHHILEKILDTNTNISLHGDSRKITVLFADIRDFTSLAEAYPAEKIVSLLNEYFAYMLDVIFAHQGTLDKFLGDGIMVEFGSPIEDPHQEENAVRCAIAMQEALKKLLKKWEKEGNPKIRIGIGIHTGTAILGNIGTEKRMEYTAVGDTVNVSSKIEKETKNFAVPLLVTEETQKALEQTFPWQDLGLIHLPGREKPIRVFTLKNENDFTKDTI